MSKKYFGIDLGTENIGYAVTDEEYNIVKSKGRNCLGVSTYSSENIKANTAVERRTFRVARRRLMRRKYRVALLQELFAEPMEAVDKNFFVKLNENDLNIQHKNIKTKYSLFNDIKYRDNEYYKQYPTIYHLRNDIIENGTNDIRKLYLAIHHIVKYRGHFLITEELEGQTADCFGSDSIIQELNQILLSRMDEIDGKSDVNQILPLRENVDYQLREIYASDKMRRADKKTACYELLNASTKQQKSMVDGVFGFKINVTTLFGAGVYEKSSVPSFSFDSGYDEVEATLMNELEASDYQVICLLKQLHDNRMLIGLLKDSSGISAAMVAKYDKHQADLAELKSIIKEYAPARYDDMFGFRITDKGKIDDKINNYTKYVGGGRPNGKEKFCNGRLGVSCSQEDFGVYTKAMLTKITTDSAQERIKKILLDIEDRCFMPRIVSKNNSLIPYQLNMLELSKILSKARSNDKFAFIKSCEDGLTVADKIKLLLSFRVPYYVGPLKYYHNDEKKSKFAWAVRKEGMTERITPWNFDLIIDKAASNEIFISRMSSQCTFLKGKTALPKNSILYCQYMALSELNKLKINDVTLNYDIKNEIWKTIYMGGNGKPSIAKILSFLKTKGINNVKLSGYSDNLKGDMSVYHCFKRIIGEKVDTMPEVVERLIFLMTVHNESKILEQSITCEFGKILSTNEIKMLKGMRFNGWGRLSKELLAGGSGGITLFDKVDGQHKNIINIMMDTNLTIMEIMNLERFDYIDRIKQYNIDNGIVISSDVTYEDVDAMYCSPSVKRSVWQTFKLIKSLVKETGGKPNKVFIEVTREVKDDKKGITVSRKEQIMSIYDSAIKAKKDIYFNDINALRSQLDAADNKRLNSEKIFLYFMQMGRCAYSNKHIDIGDDFSKLSAYDVDHIIPQSKKKDDSINNKVLVNSILNKEKDNIYPICDEYRKAASGLWKYLTSVNLMSEDKYTRLMRVTPISQEEQDNFINRQLVETGQIALLVRDLLDRWLNNGDGEKTEIIMNKAANISDFRKNYCLTKSRDANNFHHAVDAYLNIVVGNVLNDKFNHNHNYARQEGREGSTNFKKVFDNNVYSYREQRYIWENTKEYCTIDKVCKMLDTNDVQVAKKVVTGKGELYNATIYKSDKYSDKSEGKTKKFTMKESKVDVNGKEVNAKSDANYYGYKKSSGTAYFVVVDSIVKRAKVRSIEAISIYHDSMIKANKITIGDVLEEKGLVEAKLANLSGMKKATIKVGALMYFNGAYLRIAGITEGQLIFHNANELHLPSELNSYLKELSTVSDKILKATALCKKEERDARNEEEFSVLQEDKRRRLTISGQNSIVMMITTEDNLRLYDYLCMKARMKPFSGIPGYANFINLINNSRDAFVLMTTCKQVFVLLKLIKGFQCNASKVDGSDLYYKEGDKIVFGKKIMCTIRTNINISQPTLLIHQNSSGLKQHRVVLWEKP